MESWLINGLNEPIETKIAHKNDGGRLCLSMKRWANVEILARISITRSSMWEYPLRYRLGKICYACWIYCC